MFLEGLQTSSLSGRRRSGEQEISQSYKIYNTIDAEWRPNSFLIYKSHSDVKLEN